MRGVAACVYVTPHSCIVEAPGAPHLARGQPQHKDALRSQCTCVFPCRLLAAAPHPCARLSVCGSPAVWGELLLSLHNLGSVASPKLLISVTLHLGSMLPGLPMQRRRMEAAASAAALCEEFTVDCGEAFM